MRVEPSHGSNLWVCTVVHGAHVCTCVCDLHACATHRARERREGSRWPLVAACVHSDQWGWGHTEQGEPRGHMGHRVKGK